MFEKPQKVFLQSASCFSDSISRILKDLFPPSGWNDILSAAQWNLCFKSVSQVSPNTNKDGSQKWHVFAPFFCYHLNLSLLDFQTE